MSDIRDDVKAAMKEVGAAHETEEPEVKEELAPIEETKEPENVEEEPAVITAQPTPETILPPDDWSAEDKEVFSKVDNTAKNFLIRRHKEMQAGFTRKQQEVAEKIKEVSEKIRYAEKFGESVAPYSEYLKIRGVDPFTAFSSLMNTERTLRMGTEQEKVIALLEAAKRYGINLAAGIDDEMNSPAPQPDERTRFLLERQEKVEQYIQHLHSEREREQKQIVEHANHAAATALHEFKNEKDESGQLKYPHFETIKNTMGRLMDSGVPGIDRNNINLAKLYEQAILLHEDLRQGFISSRAARQEAAQNALQRVEASKKAASINVKSAGDKDIREPARDETVGQTLRRVWRQSHTR